MTLIERALSIQLKLLKIWKQRQIVQKFPRNVFRNSTNCWKFEMWTFQPKILEIRRAKLNGQKTSRKKFPKIWLYLARLSSFYKFWKMLCHSLLEVAKNANQTFWLNGKHPKLPNKLKWSIRFWLKVWLLLGKVEMETRIFWHGTTSFDRIRPTGQRGPPVEVDHFDHR